MRRKPSAISPVLGSVAIVVALYTVLFGGMRNFTGEDAERMLADLSTHLSTESARRSKETKLQYSAVEMEGIAYDKVAHVSNLSLDFIYQQWQGGRRFGISTERADIVPDQADPKRMIMRFSDMLNIISSSQLLAMVRPAKPIIYTTNLKPKNADAVVHKIVVPGNISITTLAPKHEFHLKLKQPVQAEVSFFKAQHKLNAQILAGAVQAYMPSGSWQLGDADIRYDSIQRSTETVESKGTLTLNNIAFTIGNIVSSPYTMTAAWMLKEQRNISGANDASELVIEHGLLTNGDMKLAINGTVNVDIDDTAYGELVLEITNPEVFLESSLIWPEKRALARQLLAEIMGDSDEHKQAIINISRGKNGSWQIGKMTLDALIEKGLMNIFIFGKHEGYEENSSSENTKANPS